MKKLKDKILSSGYAINETVLKVDSFVNHQVDPKLMQEIGEYLAEKFKDRDITKVATVESSGIPPAAFTALYLGVDLVVLKKVTSKVLSDDLVQDNYSSFTSVNLSLQCLKNLLKEGDNVLVIDDFLANGQAALGSIKLIEKVGGNVSAVGILIEKSFQPGRKLLEEKGYEVLSLARIKSMSPGCIEFEE